MVWFQFCLRSLHSLRRSFMATLMMFGFPVIFFFVFGVLMQDSGEPAKLRIAVDQVAEQSQFVRRVGSLDGVELVPMTDAQADEAFDRGELAMTVAAAGGTLQARINKSYSAVVETTLRAARAPSSSNNAGVRTTVVEPKTSVVRYAMPGLFALALLQLAIYATAVPMLDERAKGVWRLFATLPISTSSIFLGETASRLIVAALQLGVLILLFELVLGFDTTGSWLAALPVFLVATFMCIAFGFALGGSIPDERWGIHVLTFLNLYMLFFGNIFAASTFDEETRWLALINPITYAVDAIREVLTGIPGTFSLSWSIAAMLAWTILAIVAAKAFFRFETTTTE